MSSTDQVLEMELEKQYKIALADLKQAYMDTRINPDIKKELEDIEEKYERLKIKANGTNLDEKIAAELQRKGFEDRFLNNPEFRYYGRELVESNMKKLTDAVNNNHLGNIWQLTHDYEQSLRCIDEGMDPARYIEYEYKKHEIELDERRRREDKYMLIRIKREREYKAQAMKEAETFQRSRNTFPGDFASGHRYGA